MADNFLERTAGFEDFIRRSQGLPLNALGSLTAQQQLPAIAGQQPQIIPSAQQPEDPFRETALGRFAETFVPGVRGTFEQQRRSALSDLIKDPKLNIQQKTAELAKIDPNLASQFLGLEQAQGSARLTNQKILEIQEKRKQGITVPSTAGLPDNHMWQKDPATGQMKAVKIPGLEGVLDIKPDIEGEQKLRKEFSDQTKEFRDVNRAFGRIKASVENPSPAGDLSLIFNFMKMLDPGSVVRESEFRTAATARPLIERAGLTWDSVKTIWKGNKLTPKPRIDFMNRANKLFIAQRQIAEESKKAYDDLATEYGFKPERITATFQPITEGDDIDIDKPLTSAEQTELQALEVKHGNR